MISRLSTRFIVAGCAALLLAACGGSQPPTALQLSAATSPTRAAPFASTHHMTFDYTGAEQTFEVPDGVTHIRVIAVGGSGAGDVFVAHGGRVSAVIPVTPSETLAIFVGGAGTSSAGGFNGGGAGGATGGYGEDGFGAGGASDVREGGDTLDDRVVVAGGGGGQGFGASQFGNGDDSDGGHGGTRTGDSGKKGCCKHFGNGGTGGAGGTQYQGGSGGSGPAQPGVSGQLGYGGAGGSGCVYTFYCGYFGGSGGGGGGGYYGGGGGGGGAFFGCCGTGGGGGGAGGSSYVEPSATKSRMWSGSKSDKGNGVVDLTW